jgi:DNA-directed RNA polymerase subunit alpha
MLDTSYIVTTGVPEGSVEPQKPEIRLIEVEGNYGKLSIEPLQRGYGITIGNPLRRILISSIPGSAITWVKIDNVVHEYTAIEGVKEEVMDLLLNIKRIRINSPAQRTGKMRLEVTGEGTVCAGDISTSADFEIVNPELHLATLNDPEVTLSIEFNVDQGVGYQPAVQNEGVSGLPVGVLPIDAIFNPIRKVDYTIERTRVGQVTDFERLVLEVWTDGTVAPLEAVQKAAEALVHHFFIFSNFSVTDSEGPPTITPPISPAIFQMPLEKLQLSPRTANCLKRAHINRVGEVVGMSDEDLLKIRNFGDRSLQELKEKLGELNIPSQAGQAASGPAENGSAAAEDTPVPIADLSPGDLGELMGSDDVSAATSQMGTGELETAEPESDQDDGDQVDAEEEAD